MAESKKGRIQIKIGKGRFFSLLTAVFTFVLMFFNWFKAEALGESISFSIFHSDMFDLDTCLGIAKVFAIIALVVGILYIIALAINFEKLVPGLKKFKFGFNRLFGLVFYGLLCFALLFNIIGCIATDGVVPTVKIILIFIYVILLVVFFAIPAISRGLSKKFELVLE